MGSVGSWSRQWPSGPRASLLLLVVTGCVVALVSSFSSFPVAYNRQVMSRSDVSMAMMGRTGRRLRIPFRRKKDVSSRKSGVIDTLPIMVKPRPMVTVSTETGEFIRVEEPESPSEPKRSKWSAFKQTVYGAADGISSIPTLFRRNDNEGPRPIEGYGDTIEQVVLPSSPMGSAANTPGQRLMKQLESNPRAFVDDGDAAPQPPQKKSTWDSVKSGVYGTLDGVSGLFFADEKTPAKPPIASYKPIAQESFSSSPTIKSAMADLNSPNPIQKLKAEYAIREWENKQRRKQLETERAEFAADLKESIYSFFDGINSFIEMLVSLPDKAVETANSVQQFATTSVEFLSSIPQRIEQFVQDMQDLSNQVQQGVEDTKHNIENGIEISKAVVKDVQALPQTVSQSVADAKRRVIETQQALEETVTNIKVLVGAEKPKPKPPKAPPKPASSKDMAWRVAGSVATGSAKAAFWVGKGAVGLGVKGAQFLWSKASKTEAGKEVADKMASISSQVSEVIPSPPKTTKAPRKVAKVPALPKTTTTMAQTKEVKVPTPPKMEAKVSTPPKKETKVPASPKKETTVLPKLELPSVTADTTPPAPTISQQEQDSLDREVEEAMKLAEEALKLADDEATSASELEDAVQRARDAALKATKEALEIEQSLKKK